MLRSVLIPTDLGTDSSQVVRFAAGMSAQGLKRALLVNVVEASGMEGPVIAATIDRVRERLACAAEPLRAAGIDVELRVVTGDPSRELAVLGEHSNVDGVVCGTHAKTALTKFFAGSVSGDLVARTSQPVVLARYDLLRDSADPRVIGQDFARNLVVAVDFSASATRATLMLTQIPKEAVRRVVLVHVVDGGIPSDRVGLAKQSAEFQLASTCQLLGDAGIDAECIVRHGEPRQVILDEIRAHRATGCVTGTRGRTGLQEAMLGSTSMALIRGAECPVMIVP